jgi:hypothetical protein
MEPKINLDGYEDTITLSSLSPTYSNTTIAGGGYTVNTAVSASSYPYTVTGTGTGGLSYPNVTIGAGTGISSPWGPTGLSSKIRLDGEDADIEVNGESLVGMIKKIEERLNILHPNDELEAEWEELRELGNRYRALEAKLKEQGEMWKKLKAMPPPEID